MKKEKNNSFSLLVNSKLEIKDIDTEFAQKLRFSAKELTGKSIQKIIYPIDKDSIVEIITTGEQNGCICKSRFISKTNNIITTKIKFNRINKGLLFKIKIIEEKIDNLESTRWQLKLYQNSLSILKAGLILTDKTGNIIYVSQSTEKVLLKITKKIIGNNIKDFIENKNLFEMIKNSKKNRLDGELNFKTTDKTLFLRFFAEKFNDEKNGIYGFLFTFFDVSHIKKMQEEHTRVDKLASLGILASGIAHEIRNPLAGIKAMAQTILEDIDKSTETFDYITRIIKQVNRLDKILKVFFSYARPKATFRTTVDITELIDDIAIMLKYNFDKKNITLIKKISDDLPLLYVDPDQLQQILINLLLNSIDAISQPEGTIEIKIKKTNENISDYKIIDKCSDHKTGRWVTISIKDSGDGIPEDIKEKIFDPFFTTKSRGSGLGLSIVYQLVNENCGKLTFKSEKERGTTFSLMLPYKK